MDRQPGSPRRCSLVSSEAEAGSILPRSGFGTFGLTTVLKERLQKFCATACQNTAAHFYSVVQSRVIQHLHDRLHGARLRIVRAINQALDPGMHQRPRTHWARFNCGKQVAVGQAMVTHGCGSFAQRHNLGVGCGIAVSEVAVPSASDDASLAHDNGSDRHFARFLRALRRSQSLLHPQFVRLAHSSLVVGVAGTQTHAAGYHWRSVIRPAGAFERYGEGNLDQSSRSTERTTSGTAARMAAGPTIITSG